MFDTQRTLSCFHESVCVRIHSTSFAARASLPVHYVPESFLALESRLSSERRDPGVDASAELARWKGNAGSPDETTPRSFDLAEPSKTLDS